MRRSQVYPGIDMRNEVRDLIDRDIDTHAVLTFECTDEIGFVATAVYESDFEDGTLRLGDIERQCPHSVDMLWDSHIVSSWPIGFA